MGIKITNIETMGWAAAIRGMRNSYQSWEKSDSEYLPQVTDRDTKVFFLGDNDLQLAMHLAKLGGSHAKFRRMIHVQCDISAPMFWWKQFDTYKIGTVANSTSTMHNITTRAFTSEDFGNNDLMSMQFGMCLLGTINTLNELRELYLNETDQMQKKMYFDDIIHLLPESYMQLRTVDLNYEVIAHMVRERMHHKLDEWKEFCKRILEECPYSEELIYGTK